MIFLHINNMPNEFQRVCRSKINKLTKKLNSLTKKRESLEWRLAYLACAVERESGRTGWVDREILIGDIEERDILEKSIVILSKAILKTRKAIEDVKHDSCTSPEDKGEPLIKNFLRLDKDLWY